MKKILLLFLLMFSSCWLNKNSDERTIPIVSYSDKSEVLLDSLVVKDIYVDRGMVSLNSRVHVLDSYLTGEVTNKRPRSFWRSINKGDSIFFHLEENGIIVDKNDGNLLYFRKKIKSDYSWFDEWW